MSRLTRDLAGRLRSAIARARFGFSVAKPRADGERGFIIVAVLWILGALAVLAAVFAVYVNQMLWASVDLNDRLQAEQLALGGLELAMLQRLQPRAGVTPAISGDRLSFKMGRADVLVELRSENARIDLNAAPRETLVGLFAALGASRQRAESIGDRIVAWRTPLAGGASDPEASLYRSAGKAYAPRRGPFQHVNEVGLVLDLTPELLQLALPSLTVYSGRPEINVREATPEVVAALPGLTPEALHLLLDQRGGIPLDVLKARLGSAAGFATVEQSRTVRALIEIRFDAKRSSRFEIVVLPLITGDEPYRILSWSDDADGSFDTTKFGPK